MKALRVRMPMHNLMDRAEDHRLVRSEEIHELCRIYTVRVELGREQLRREALGPEARIAVRLLTVPNPDSDALALLCVGAWAMGRTPCDRSSVEPLLAQRRVGQLIGDLPDDRLRGALVGLRCVRLVVGLLDLR